VTPDDHLAVLLKGNKSGLTRAELAYRLRVPDRQVRDLIADAITSAGLPIVADRSAGGEARYRLARSDEIDVINAEAAELHARAASCRRRAENLKSAWLTYHNSGGLFMAAEPPAAERSPF
jgi:hypothetical protein